MQKARGSPEEISPMEKSALQGDGNPALFQRFVQKILFSFVSFPRFSLLFSLIPHLIFLSFLKPSARSYLSISDLSLLCFLPIFSRKPSLSLRSSLPSFQPSILFPPLRLLLSFYMGSPALNLSPFPHICN